MTVILDTINILERIFKPSESCNLMLVKSRIQKSVSYRLRASSTDKRYMVFGHEFEQRFLKQGFDENRSMDQTLELAWDLLSMLPKTELDRMNAKLIEEHYRD